MSEQNPYQSGGSWTPAQEKTAAVLVHVGSIFFEVLVPIIGYVLLKDKGPFIRHHAKESLNFMISIALYSVILAISIIGLIVLWAVPVVWLVLRIIAAVKAAEGAYYKYPLTIRFIK